jgi:hypothetical protein
MLYDRDYNDLTEEELMLMGKAENFKKEAIHRNLGLAGKSALN